MNSIPKMGLAMLGAFASVGAIADVSITQQIIDRSVSTDYSNRAPIELEHSLLVSGNTAYSFAGIATGTLRSSSSSIGTSGRAQSQAALSDTFSFIGGIGQTAYIDWTFDGSLTLAPDPPFVQASQGTFSLSYVDPLSQRHADGHTLNSVVCATVLPCTVGTTISIGGSLAIPIMTGSYSFGSALTALAVLGDDSNFANTSRLYLRLPEGVSITSRSGEFLAEAVPLFSASPVPETETYALLLAGFGVVAARIRRRRERKA